MWKKLKKIVDNEEIVRYCLKIFNKKIMEGYCLTGIPQ